MPQNRHVSFITTQPVNSAASQGVMVNPTTLIGAGAPGGPVVFSNPGAPIVAALYGAVPRSAVQPR